MDWFRVNYDRAPALAAASFPDLCAGFIFLGASGFSKKLGALQSMPPPNNRIPADQAAEIVEAMAQLQRPSQWTSSGPSGLFVPEKHLSARMVSLRLCKTRSSIRLCLTNGWSNSVSPSPRPTFWRRMPMEMASPIATSGQATQIQPIRTRTRLTLRS